MTGGRSAGYAPAGVAGPVKLTWGTRAVRAVGGEEATRRDG